MSWCPSGVQYAAALSADFNYRRYSMLRVQPPTGESENRASGLLAWSWLLCGWNAYGARFVCEQRSVGSAVGITNPVEGVQPRRWVMSPDASCVSQVAVDLVFSADLAPWCGRRLLSFFWS